MNSLAAEPESLAERLAAILGPLAILVAARFRILGPWTVPIWTRLTRAARRIARLLANPPAPRTAPRAALARGGPPPIALPGRNGFLLDLLKHEAAYFTSRLDRLLAEPEAAAQLAANPAALRALRPFCRLLGVTFPPSLRPPRRPKPAPAMLPSAPRLGRNDACPPPDPPPPRSPVPPDGCWCSNPAAGPYWPFPRGPTAARPSRA